MLVKKMRQPASASVRTWMWPGYWNPAVIMDFHLLSWQKDFVTSHCTMKYWRRERPVQFIYVIHSWYTQHSHTVEPSRDFSRSLHL
jgi:hypothetical protein